MKFLKKLRNKDYLVNSILPFLLIVIVSLVIYYPILKTGKQIIFNDDFLLALGRHEYAKISYFKYHVMPLWSPWHGGGYPTIADPPDSALNPLLLISSLFGSVMGLKIIGLFSLILCGSGLYIFTRRVLGYGLWSGLYAGVLGGTQAFLLLRIADGNLNEIYYSFIPWILYLLVLAIKNKSYKYIYLIPFFMYVILSDGKTSFFVISFFMFLIVFLSLFFKKNYFFDIKNTKQRLKPIYLFALVIIITVFLGMIKIVPMQELLRDYGGLSKPQVISHLQTYSKTAIGAYDSRKIINEITGQKIGYLYLGFMPFILFLLTLFTRFRKNLFWLILLCFYLWLILAYNASLDLFKILYKYPFFNAIVYPEKYFSWMISFLIIIISGDYINYLEKLKNRYWKYIFLLLILVSVGYSSYKLIDLQNRTIKTYLPKLEYNNSFYQIKSRGLKRLRADPVNSILYFNVMRNIGTIDWPTAFPKGERTEPKYFIDPSNQLILNNKYKGEVYFGNPENKAEVVFRPNSIVISVNIKVPDILIINQNYSDYWKTNNGELYNYQGLLALRIKEKGLYQIKMDYYSKSFMVGSLISSITLLVLLFLIFLKKR